MNKRQQHLKTLFLTSALALTTLLGSAKNGPKNQSRNDNTKQRTEEADQQVKTGAPTELLQVVPAQDNTYGVFYVTVDIKDALKADLVPSTHADDMDMEQFNENGQLMARIYVDPAKNETKTEYLNQYGPFTPSNDPTSPIYKTRLDDAFSSVMNKVNPFLKENIPQINRYIENEGLVEINYANQSITSRVGDNTYMTINLKDDKVTMNSEFDRINLFYRTTKNSHVIDLNAMPPQDRSNAVNAAKSVLEIGAKTRNTPSKNYHWNP